MYTCLNICRNNITGEPISRRKGHNSEQKRNGALFSDSSSPLTVKARLTDASSCHMMTVTMGTGATEEAAGISKRPVGAGLITPG